MKFSDLKLGDVFRIKSYLGGKGYGPYQKKGYNEAMNEQAVSVEVDPKEDVIIVAESKNRDNPRLFKVQTENGEKVYRGFDRNIIGADKVCIIQIGKVVEVYGVDEENGVKDLTSFLSWFFGPESYRIVGVFERKPYF